MTSSAAPTTLTLSLDPGLARALASAAADREWTPESLAADCIAQHLEIAIRHRVLVERMEAMDAHIEQICDILGHLSASSGGLDLSGVCKYDRATKDKP